MAAPRGREKNITGEGKELKRRGEGLGIQAVEKRDSDSVRKIIRGIVSSCKKKG